MINPLSYKELAVGDFFFCSRAGGYFGLKLSERRFFDLNAKHIYGFCNNKANVSDAKNYLKCDCDKRLHGEWTHSASKKYHVICSICKYESIIWNANFCPNCGANMRGDTE